MSAPPDLATLTSSLALAHETDYARVHVARPTRLLVLEWFAYANPEQFRQTLEDALAIARELGSERWVEHDQWLEVIAPASQRFITEPSTRGSSGCTTTRRTPRRPSISVPGRGRRRDSPRAPDGPRRSPVR